MAIAAGLLQVLPLVACVIRSSRDRVGTPVNAGSVGARACSVEWPLGTWMHRVAGQSTSTTRSGALPKEKQVPRACGARDDMLERACEIKRTKGGGTKRVDFEPPHSTP